MVNLAIRIVFLFHCIVFLIACVSVKSLRLLEVKDIDLLEW